MATEAVRITAQSSQDKVALITGGRRVGGELALLMAAQGWRVAMTYHTSRAAIERTIEAVAEQGTAGLAIAADLARPEQAENAINQVVAVWPARRPGEHGERVPPHAVGRSLCTRL